VFVQIIPGGGWRVVSAHLKKNDVLDNLAVADVLMLQDVLFTLDDAGVIGLQVSNGNKLVPYDTTGKKHVALLGPGDEVDGAIIQKVKEVIVVEEADRLDKLAKRQAKIDKAVADAAAAAALTAHGSELAKEVQIQAAKDAARDAAELANPLPDPIVETAVADGPV